MNNEKYKEEVAKQFAWNKCKWWYAMTLKEKIKYVLKDYIKENNEQDK